MKRFLTENSTTMRLARTFVQQIIAAVVSVLVTWQATGELTATAIMGAVTLVLTWLMGTIKPSGINIPDEEEILTMGPPVNADWEEVKNNVN